MQIPDLVNGLFEGLGSVLTWLNVAQLIKDRGYAGVKASITVFWFLWGVWNLYYYPHLGQWLSFTGGVSIMIGNLAWVLLAWKYGPKK